MQDLKIGDKLVSALGIPSSYIKPWSVAEVIQIGSESTYNLRFMLSETSLAIHHTDLSDRSRWLLVLGPDEEPKDDQVVGRVFTGTFEATRKVTFTMQVAAATKSEAMTAFALMIGTEALSNEAEEHMGGVANGGIVVLKAEPTTDED